MEKAITRERRDEYLQGVREENPEFLESFPLGDFSGLRVRGPEGILDWEPVRSPNLLLIGPSGSGKSLVSDSIFRYCLGLKVLYDITFISEDIVEPRYQHITAYKVSPVQMVSDMSSNYFAAKHSLVSRMLATRVLIIDGLSHEKVPQDSFWQSALLQVLDGRLSDPDKKTVLTTHLAAAEMKRLYRDAIAHRIMGNHFAKVLLGE